MRDQVIRAIRRDHPDYVPLIIWNQDFDQSDIVYGEIQKHFLGENRDYSEWGFYWSRKDETMGQPREPLIKDWNEIDKLKPPSLDLPGRFDELLKKKETYPEKFLMASLALSGFTTMTFLAHFEEVLIHLSTKSQQLERLIDVVFNFEESLIRETSNFDVDAIAFLDDWGSQNGLMVSPDHWRKIFKPRYRKQFDLVHQQGMYVYFHSCGYIYPIISDFIEIGVDILNISQPNLYEIPKLGRDFGGKVCFCCPVSYQTTGISGNPQEIEQYTEYLFEHLGRFNGGLIGYAEEYHSIGMSEESYRASIRGFKKLRYF
jgi:uroporphyrinogen decarboxylase